MRTQHLKAVTHAQHQAAAGDEARQRLAQGARQQGGQQRPGADVIAEREAARQHEDGEPLQRIGIGDQVVDVQPRRTRPRQLERGRHLAVGVDAEAGDDAHPDAGSRRAHIGVFQAGTRSATGHAATGAPPSRTVTTPSPVTSPTTAYA